MVCIFFFEHTKSTYVRLAAYAFPTFGKLASFGSDFGS
jgi:hypothetical protein